MGGANLSKTKPNQILFHICEQPSVSWGSCRVLSQLDKCTASSAALNGQSEIETVPTRGCHLTFNPSHKTLLLLLYSSSPGENQKYCIAQVQIWPSRPSWQSPDLHTTWTWTWAWQYWIMFINNELITSEVSEMYINVRYVIHELSSLTLKFPIKFQRRETYISKSPRKSNPIWGTKNMVSDCPMG